MAVTWREKLVAFNPAPILEAIADLATKSGLSDTRAKYIQDLDVNLLPQVHLLTLQIH